MDLAYVKGEGLVGVRWRASFCFPEVIAGCYEAAQTKQAVIPVIDVVETVRHLTKPEVKRFRVMTINWFRLLRSLKCSC